jgi:hypothetical protein
MLHGANMVKWIKLFLSLIEILIWKFSVFPPPFQSVFVDTKFKNYFSADLISNFSGISTLDLVLF